MTNSLTLNPFVLTSRVFDLRPVARIFALFCIASVLFLFSFYIYQINKIVSEGYLIQSYEQEQERLQNENERMEINLAGMATLKNVQTQIVGLGFEETGKVHYVQGADVRVVLK